MNIRIISFVLILIIVICDFATAVLVIKQDRYNDHDHHYHGRPRKIYKYVHYPIRVPIKVPVYIEMKKPNDRLRSVYGRKRTHTPPTANRYDHGYAGHLSHQPIRGNQGRRFGQLGFGEQIPDYTGLGRFNQNQYDDSKA